MKKQLHFFILACFAAMSAGSAQVLENIPAKPTYIGKPTSVVKVPSIASRKNLVRPDLSRPVEAQDGRASRHDIIPGKGSSGDDPLWQRDKKNSFTRSTRDVELVFETSNSTIVPTDPAGAVGPNHYFTVTNSAFQIFDKQGNSLTDGLIAPTPTIFPGSGCCDLTIAYDNLADRYVMTFLKTGDDGGVHIAISDGPDPINDTWTAYFYDKVADYNKLSVWRDGYYVTDNNATADKVHVFERDKMILGDPNAQIVSFDLPGLARASFFSPQVFHIASSDFPTGGGATVVYLQDDAFSGVTTDHLKLWTIDLDWTDVNNSSVSAATEIPVTPFVSVFDNGSFNNLAQPDEGEKIDAIQGAIMNQAVFRKFSTHNSAVFNFVVDVDGSDAKQAGIRWYEFRQATDTDPWQIYQEGTYTGPDNRHAWMGSMSIDKRGNIALGYSGMSSPNSTNANVLVGSYYTGRFPSDPLGQMTIEENLIMASDANIPSIRYGDYAQIDIDPSDNVTFWFVNELMQNGRKNIAGSFKLQLLDRDIGVVDITSPEVGALTDAEEITITINNLGLIDATNFEVSYQIDGGTVVTETFTGTISSTLSADYTFNTKADLSTEGHTYTIAASVNFSGDEHMANNSYTTNVKHLFRNDTGISEIVAPVSGPLSTSETISVSIANYGSLTQTSVPISYSIDGGAAVNETYTGSIVSGESDTYSFSTTADLSAYLNQYNVSAATNLTTDSDNTNDAMSVTVINKPNMCIPKATIGCFVDGIKRFVLKDIDADDGRDGCNGENGYEDRTHLMTDLTISTNTTSTFNVQAQQNWNDGVNKEKFSVWIDMDDSGTFEESERYISGQEFTAADELVSFSMVLPADPPQGFHVLRAKAIDTTSGGDILDPCTDFGYGEVQDYVVNLTLTVGFDDIGIDAPFRIITLEDKHFEITMPTSEFTDRLEFKVYDVTGKQIYWRSLYNESGLGYSHILNMSFMPSGVYFVTLGNDHVQQSGRIIVE